VYDVLLLLLHARRLCPFCVLTPVVSGFCIALISTFRSDHKNETEILAMKLLHFTLKGASRLIVYYAQFPLLQVVSDCIFSFILFLPA
jgi:hypothetical protein